MDKELVSFVKENKKLLKSFSKLEEGDCVGYIDNDHMMLITTNETYKRSKMYTKHNERKKVELSNSLLLNDNYVTFEIISMYDEELIMSYNKQNVDLCLRILGSRSIIRYKNTLPIAIQNEKFTMLIAPYLMDSKIINIRYLKQNRNANKMF